MPGGRSGGVAPSRCKKSLAETAKIPSESPPDTAKLQEGSRVEVLFDTNRWFQGTVLAFIKKRNAWKVKFDDGDEEFISFPDPEVRVLGHASSSLARETQEEPPNRRTRRAASADKKCNLHASDSVVVVGTTRIRKAFPGFGTFVGLVTKHNPEDDTFEVEYTDGDKEDLSRAKIKKLEIIGGTDPPGTGGLGGKRYSPATRQPARENPSRSSDPQLSPTPQHPESSQSEAGGGVIPDEPHVLCEAPPDQPVSAPKAVTERDVAWKVAARAAAAKHKKLERDAAQLQKIAKRCALMCRTRVRRDARAAVQRAHGFEKRGKKVAQEVARLWKVMAARSSEEQQQIARAKEPDADDKTRDGPHFTRVRLLLKGELIGSNKATHPSHIARQSGPRLNASPNASAQPRAAVSCPVRDVPAPQINQGPQGILDLQSEMGSLFPGVPTRQQTKTVVFNSLATGTRVQARWKLKGWFPGKVEQTHADGTMQIVFEDGSVEDNQSHSDVRLDKEHHSDVRLDEEHQHPSIPASARSTARADIAISAAAGSSQHSTLPEGEKGQQQARQRGLAAGGEGRVAEGRERNKERGQSEASCQPCKKKRKKGGVGMEEGYLGQGQQEVDQLRQTLRHREEDITQLRLMLDRERTISAELRAGAARLRAEEEVLRAEAARLLEEERQRGAEGTRALKEEVAGLEAAALESRRRGEEREQAVARDKEVQACAQRKRTEECVKEAVARERGDWERTLADGDFYSTCPVCMEQPARMCLTPCGHFRCVQCDARALAASADTPNLRACPICRKRVEFSTLSFRVGDSDQAVAGS